MNCSTPDQDFRSRLAESVRDGNNVGFCRLLPRATASDLESGYPLTSGATALKTFHLLGLCCYYGRDKQVEALFQNPVQVDVDYKAKGFQKEALYNSVDPGTPQSVKILDLIKIEAERQGQPLIRHDYIWSLRTASTVGNVAVVQWILEKIQIETSERNFAFRIAATNGQLEVARFYTEQFTADALKQMIHHNEDWTFIDTASNGHLQVVNFLIQKSQEIDDDIDFQHMIHAKRDTAFVRAVHSNQVPVVERLLQLTLDHDSRHQMVHAEDMFYSKDAAFKYSARLGHHQILEILVNEIDNVTERRKIAKGVFFDAVGSNNLETLQYLIKIIKDEAIQIAVIEEAFINQASGDDDDVIQSLELILNIIPAKKEYILENRINEAFVKASQISSTPQLCTVVQEFLLDSVRHERRLELVTLVEDRQKRRVGKYIQDLQLKERLLSQADSKPLMVISTIDKFESRNLRIPSPKSPLPSAMSDLDFATRLHDLLASHPVTGRLYTIPLLIFFAKQGELNHAIPFFRSSNLCEIERDPIIDDVKLEFLPGSIHVEYVSNGSRQVGIVEFYAVCGQEQGPENAAAVVSYILTKYRPKFAISIGICAGIHQIKLHDVLLATSAINYEAGKMNSDGSFELDLHPFHADSDVKNQVRHLIGANESKTYQEGCMLTGSAVRKDADLLFQKYKDRLPRDVKGLDMEASAFLTACKLCGVVAMPVIKGISDMGDAAKSDETHRVCVERATKAGLRLLKSYFSKSQMQKYWKKN